LALNLPQRGDNNWDTPLNAALNTLDARVQLLNLVAGVKVVAVPALPTSAGSIGQIAVDSTYLYVCVGTNTWVRVARTAW
jgi:hypothetical protein